ncbi:MAG: 8-amino-7-oxononanoate synthase [Lachnoclostridium sp.]|nr:8-amino-7-oxononanoate synthase [Lachnoclostridium sp.]
MTGYFESQLGNLRKSGNFRTIPSDTSASLMLTDLSSNDYLGLALREDLRDEFYDTREFRSIPMSSSASRLLAASQDHYASLENHLKELYDRDILLFNSGYHANTGLISSLAAGSKTMVVADRLVHASIIDGTTLSRSRFTRFPHNDFNKLEQIISRYEAEVDRILVAVESIYSMDGDRADIEALIAIKRRHPKVMLYVDEAHAFGVEGKNGLGVVNNVDILHEVDVIVGTFGKAAASMGAFCATTASLRDYAVNKARSFIFSTALPPVTVAWTEFIVRHIVAMDAERKKLHRLSLQLAEGLKSICGVDTMASHIQPFITGDPVEAIRLSQRLAACGFKVLPIRVPTVPAGTDRLRISLSAHLSADDISKFLSALEHEI